MSSEYPPFAGGGIGTYSAITARALAAAGHEVHVIANAWLRHADGAPSEVPGPGRVAVHRVAALDRGYRPVAPHDRTDDPLGAVCRGRDCSLYWSFLVAERLAALVRRVELDVVEFPECFAEGYVSLMRRAAADIALDRPMTLTLHSPIREIARYNELRHTDGWVARRGVAEDAAIRAADAVSSPSRRLGEMVAARLGFDTARRPIATIPNAMDFEAADAALARVAAVPPAEPPRLVFAGRLEPRKGVRELVRAAVELLPAWPELTVELIGRDGPAGVEPGSMKERLLELVPAALRRRFVFRDLVPRPRLFELFATARAAVFVPEWDNFPYTCCEAMAVGGAVIVTAASGMAELVEDGRSGLVVPPGDRAALVAAMTRVLAEPGLSHAIGAAAATRVRVVCAPAAVIPRRLEHYHETIERWRSGRQARRRTTVTTTTKPRTIAVLVTAGTAGSDPAATASSARAAARRAGLAAEISVAAGSADGEAPSAGGDQGLAQWLAGLEASRPELMLVLAAGETVGEEYLEIVCRALKREPDGAWATTWSLAVEGSGGEPFSGLDFAAPLEMIHYHPVPFAVIRHDRFRAAGGFSPALPAGWREWDLWLAFLGRGWRGLVVPVWAAHHLPASGRPLPIEHPKGYEVALEAIVERNRELFRDHGATLWITSLIERLAPPCPSLVGELAPTFEARPTEGAKAEINAVPQEHLDLLRHLAEAEVEAPDGHVGEAAFFAAHPFGGLGLLAHPPARIAYRVDIGTRAFLNLSLGLHPDVYDQPGGGVRFTVEVDGEIVLERLLDPKRRPAERGWLDLSLDLGRYAGPGRLLVLTTSAVPADEPAFCTAGWGRAHLSPHPFAPDPSRAVFRIR